MGHKEDVMNYCLDVINKKELAGRYEVKAIERFLNDIEKSKSGAFPYVLDTEQADAVIDFAQSLVIPDIEKTEDNPKRQLRLLYWHKFIYYNLFGWVSKFDKTKRRFQDSYIEVARKNSKTTSILFPILLYDFLTTNAAESYFVNKDIPQSEKSFKELVKIIQADEDLTNYCEMNSQTITCKASRIAFFCDGTSAIDGYKNSCSIIDEYHCYDSDKIVTAFRYGGRSRKNRLIVKITSAGLDISKPCYAENQAAKKVLDGLHTDESYFCLIYAYDDGDDWKDISLFRKANPSLNKLPALTDEVLVADLNDALAKPQHQPDFKSKTLGIWTSGTSTWIPLNVFEAYQPNIINYDELKGDPCGLAFDLSAVNDFTALTACFKQKDKYIFKHEFFIPSETIAEKYAKDNINILTWVENGIITAIPGPTIDEEYIFNAIQDYCENYNVVALYYDPWQAKELIRKLEEISPNLLLVPFSQNLKNFSPVTKEYEKLIYQGKIIDTNPVLKWHLSNVVVKADINNNYKPMKESKASTKRIDGVITSIMARTAIDENEVKKTRAYKDFNSLLNSF